ncbi:MAG: ABC transporter ATP-binding protein [Actinomycetota bacterium]|nr:ABC transporter ATP-binding protein [Actinomycetota bacterium]MDA8208952.1 ABC transporter ATP-binding protein [Actinomycetota bacterium]
MAELITTAGLTKSYGEKLAVDSVDLSVPEGSVYGFLGPNGSGKTTTIRMLLGLIFPTAGEIELLGHPVPKETTRALVDVGAVVEGPGLYPTLSARRYLQRMSRYGRGERRRALSARAQGDAIAVAPDIDAALEMVGLSKVGNRKVKAYSLGMKQRLSLANALLYPRRLLILDEPTNGMDPQGIVEMRELIIKLASQGTTVFVSSHILSEIEQLCTHVGVIQHGRLLFQGEMGELRGQLPARLSVGTTDQSAAGQLLRARFGLQPRTEESGLLTMDRGAVAIEDIASALVGAGIGLYRLAEDRPTLEEAFVALTGEASDVS